MSYDSAPGSPVNPAEVVFRGEIRPSRLEHRRIAMATASRAVRIVWVLGFSSIAYAVLTLLYNRGHPTAVVAAFVGGLLLVSHYEIAVWAAWRTANKGGPWWLRYAVSVRGIEIVTPTATLIIAARDVRSVRRLHIGWAVSTAVQAIPIFRAAFSPDVADRVDRLLSGSPTF